MFLLLYKHMSDLHEGHLCSSEGLSSISLHSTFLFSYHVFMSFLPASDINLTSFNNSWELNTWFVPYNWVLQRMIISIPTLTLVAGNW